MIGGFQLLGPTLCPLRDGKGEGEENGVIWVKSRFIGKKEEEACQMSGDFVKYWVILPNIRGF